VQPLHGAPCSFPSRRARLPTVTWARSVAFIGVFYATACGQSHPVPQVPERDAQQASREPFQCDTLLDPSEPGDPLLPRANETLDEHQRAALRRLCASAESADTAALIVIHHGQTIVDWHHPGAADRPLPLSSITKIFDGMAIGLLVDEGRLTLDAPLSRFFPEWNRGTKSRVTIEQVLRHTAGLQRPTNLPLMDHAPNALEFARALPLADDPGAHFLYSNAGAELLVGVVQVASGMPLDVLIRQRVFAPLGIERFHWQHDPTGAPYGYGGLWLRPHDLARVGEMLRSFPGVGFHARPAVTRRRRTRTTGC
jgi:CubicO group peptidase (beta-lactamase class C family)